MLFRLPIQPLPKIEQVYELDRKTVWFAADRRNIMIFITDGSCLVELGGEKITLNRGDALLIPSGQEYTRRPIGDQLCRLFYIHFVTAAPLTPISEEEAEQELRDTLTENTLLSAEERLSRLPNHLYLAQKTSAGDQFEALAKLLQKIQQRRRMMPHLSPLFVALTFTEFLANLSMNLSVTLPTRTATRTLPLPLRRAMAYVQQNYDVKLSTEDLCAHCNLSPQHLIRLFKRHLNMTPLQYITKNKMSHAIELLRTSELSVKEIAYALGYDNPNYFSRLFVKEQNRSPSEVRERIRSFRGGEGALKDEKQNKK